MIIIAQVLGIHRVGAGHRPDPDGVDYRWEGPDPFMMPLSEVPEVTPEQLHTLHEAVRASFREAAERPPDVKVTEKKGVSSTPAGSGSWRARRSPTSAR